LKIFIDVNVFIDVMTKRSGWTESLRVLNLARKSPAIDGWTSALTLPLIYFFRRRVVDEATARTDAQAILKGLQLVRLSQTIIEGALTSAGPDFEDNIQLARLALNRSSRFISSLGIKKTLIPLRLLCLRRRSGSSYKKSPHSKPSSRDPGRGERIMVSIPPKLAAALLFDFRLSVKHLDDNAFMDFLAL
jgi:hypothetical protein